jgi:natural product biosynthesis luciferase-like monooxygenase protein
MRFGAHYLPTYVPQLDGSGQDFYRKMLEQIVEMDRLGFDDVWMTEHHFHVYGGLVPHPPTFLAAAAQATQRIHLGSAISVLPLHNPLMVAESYAMVDVISGGRLEFGLGRGSALKEFAEFKISHDDSATRMREAVEIIRQAWGDERFSFHGELFDYDDMDVQPKPVQRPHPPFWVGASRSDGTFIWAGEQGFNLMTLPYMYEGDVLREWVDHYREHLVGAGHHPSSREVLGKFHIYVAESDAKAREEAMPYLQNYRDIAGQRNSGLVAGTGGRIDLDEQIRRGDVIAGDPQRVIDVIHQWRERLGLTTISGTVFFGGMPQELALRNIRLFAERVIPAFARAGAAA